MDWYFQENGAQVGPVSEQEFHQHIRSGRVGANTLVWNHTMSGWQPYQNVSGIKSVPANKPVSAAMVTCSQCGRQFSPDNVIRYENASICAKCKPTFFQRLKEGGAALAGGVWRDKSKLVVTRDGRLPDRCVKCNTPARGQTLKKKLQWHPPAYYLLLCAGALFYIIVVLIVRKQATLQVGMCERHLKKRKTNIIISLSMIGLSLLLIFLGAYDNDLGALAGIGALLFLVGLVWAVVTTPMVSAARIDEQYIWLNGVDKNYLAGLPEFRV